MREQSGLAPSNGVQPPPRPGWLAAQSFELLHGPSHEMLVDARCQGVQHGAVKGPVVVDPASHLGIDILGEAGQVRAAATVEVPGPDLSALRFLGRAAHGRYEAHEEPSPAPDQPTPEGVAQEVEAGVLRFASAIRVLAVHDLRLRGVQLKSQEPEPLGKRGLQLPGLLLGIAVGNNVIRLCRLPGYAAWAVLLLVRPVIGVVHAA